MDNHQESKTQWGSDFGINLQRILHRKGITQGELACRLGTTESMVSRYICGTCVPSSYRSCLIAEAIGCNISDLVKTKYEL